MAWHRNLEPPVCSKSGLAQAVRNMQNYPKNQPTGNEINMSIGGKMRAISDLYLFKLLKNERRRKDKGELGTISPNYWKYLVEFRLRLTNGMPIPDSLIGVAKYSIPLLETRDNLERMGV